MPNSHSADSALPSVSTLEVTREEVEEAAQGLAERPPRISPKYFYDARGSRLFDAICRLPEYYLTRTERRLLEERAAEIVEQSAAQCLAELGSGMARKTEVLLAAMKERPGKLFYSPLDISVAALEESSRILSLRFPGLLIEPHVCDFTRDLGGFRSRGRCLFAFLGSSLGNFSEKEAAALLRRIRSVLREDDTFLLGLDLDKDVRVLEAAYNDAQGVTAQFNLNVLNVLNRRFGAHFNPACFHHQAVYEPGHRRIEMYLISRHEQTVDLGMLGGRLRLAAGARILTEYSHKYTREGVLAMLSAAGFRLKTWFASDDGYMALVLAEPTAAGRPAAGPH